MRNLTLGFVLMTAIGCQGIEPVGPLAGMWSKDSTRPPSKSSKDKVSVESPSKPITVPAVKPTPPLNFIYPDEVLSDNPQESVQKLKNELEEEKKNIPAPPVTAEVSHYKGGVKQN
jgi:hypothetical protein